MLRVLFVYFEFLSSSQLTLVISARHYVVLMRYALLFSLSLTVTMLLSNMHFVLRTESVAKLFFLVSCSGLLMYTILAFYTFHTSYSNMSQLYQDSVQGLPSLDYNYKIAKYRKDLRYVLVWTMANETKSSTMGEGQNLFIEHSCPYMNCYLTTNKHFLNNDYTKFDAIIFDIKLLSNWKQKNFPLTRSPRQKFIFYSTVSSDEVPICHIFTDNYFNWTWTYKIYSDIFSPFIEVQDLEGNIVAPKTVVQWNSMMTQFKVEEIKHLQLKKKAMAWVVTKCHSRNNRLLFARRLRKAFEQAGLIFDIYGCGQKTCPEEGCLSAIEKEYYFYFAPESSFDEDYVTNEVLTAYEHHAVPVVVGGANYNRFLPEGSYINAVSSSLDKLVALVEYIIRNPRVYYSFHRWRKNYVIKAVEKFRGICKVCEYLNDDYKVGSVSVKKDFRKWWYSRPLYERCFPKSAESLSDVMSYVNNSKRSNRA